MLMSRSDRRLVVYRNGVEIGWTRVDFRHPGAMTGTHAYIAGQGYMDGEVPGNPGMRMPNWFAIGTPGHEDEAHKPVSQQTVDDLVIPPRFIALLLPLMQPGSVLVATDAPILPETSGGETRTVIDSDPPG
jgi:hypothetical protein